MIDVYSMVNDYEKVLNYFIKRNIENLGFLKYKYFKGIIKYCFDFISDYETRKIFFQIEKLGFFEKRRVKKNAGRSFEYRFVNPETPIEKDSGEPKVFVLYFE